MVCNHLASFAARSMKLSNSCAFATLLHVLSATSASQAAAHHSAAQSAAVRHSPAGVRVRGSIYGTAWMSHRVWKMLPNKNLQHFATCLPLSLCLLHSLYLPLCLSVCYACFFLLLLLLLLMQFRYASLSPSCSPWSLRSCAARAPAISLCLPLSLSLVLSLYLLPPQLGTCWATAGPGNFIALDFTLRSTRRSLGEREKKRGGREAARCGSRQL